MAHVAGKLRASAHGRGAPFQSRPSTQRTLLDLATTPESHRKTHWLYCQRLKTQSPHRKLLKRRRGLKAGSPSSFVARPGRLRRRVTG